MIVFADRPLAVCAPDRGLPAVMRIRRTLEQLSIQLAESDPLAAAIRIRGMLKHRSLIVLLTDIDDASVADQLVRAVRLLAPPHLVVVAGIHSPEISELARREARDWKGPVDTPPLRSMRIGRNPPLLRQLGAPVIATSEALLEKRCRAVPVAGRSRRLKLASCGGGSEQPSVHPYDHEQPISLRSRFSSRAEIPGWAT
jgi:uncharacterized protein (DUF58 family)